MPTYQYACTDCGEQLEAVQSFTDDTLTVCPACEGRLRKVFSAVGVVFKGSGFYRNDSKVGNGSVKPGKDSAATSDSKSSDSKPDSKSSEGSTSSASTSSASTSSASTSSGSTSSGSSEAKKSASTADA